MSPKHPARPRTSPLFLSLLTLLAIALALTAAGARAASAPTLLSVESAVGRSAPSASAVVRPDPPRPPITRRTAPFIYDRIAVATGVAAKTAARACSFAGATVVLMADGSRKPIEGIKVGDEVMATDPETGEQVAGTVEQVFVHEDTVVDLVVDGEVISTTEDHPFWSVTDQRFERADELAPGEKVLGSNGRVLTVSGLRARTERTTVAYNLSVEGIHTYHVGDHAILVHNSCFSAEAAAKVPDAWGSGKSAKTGGGWRWADPNKKGADYVRVDPGRPGHPDPLQRVDHVHVSSDGKVVADHLPLDGWLKWSTWNTP